MINIISVYSSNFKNTLLNIKIYMIKIERNYKNININIKVEAIFVGNGLVSLIIGEDKSHVVEI